MSDSTINRFLASGTAAERATFTPSPPTPSSGPDHTYFWYETDTGNSYAWDRDGAAWGQVNGGLVDGDYGDISISSGVWTVDAGAITYAKIQDVSANSRLLGRVSGGSGDVEEVVLDTDDTLAADSDSRVPTQQAVKAYVDANASSGDLGALHVQDQKAAGTDGGTFTSGAWQTRDLNTVVINSISGASLSSNQITLPAGTYDVLASAPGRLVNLHQTRLRNVTDGSTVLLGTCVSSRATSSTDGTSDSVIRGRFTLAGTKALELQHQCQTTSATNGFGAGSGNTWATVVFADVFIRRIA